MTGPTTPKRSPANDRTVHAFSALYDTGLLWYINRTLFHPLGYAMSLDGPDDDPAGWALHYAGEPVTFDMEDGEEAARLSWFRQLLDTTREHGVSPPEGDAFFVDDCPHDWTLRPEHDHHVCEMCGAER